MKLLNLMAFYPVRFSMTCTNPVELLTLVIDQNLVHSVPIVVPAGILELGSSLSCSGHSNTSLLGNLMK